MMAQNPRTGGIARLDAETINMQKIVNTITARTSKLDITEDELHVTLRELAKFWSKPIDDTKKVLPQFEQENQAEFKKLANEISKSMWAVRVVVKHELTELYQYEVMRRQGISMPVSPMIQRPSGDEPKVDFSKDLQKEGFADKLNPFKPKGDPSSPYNLLQGSIHYLQSIIQKWHLCLHWYYLAVTKRLKLNTIGALKQILDNIAIVFGFYIEPNLVMAVHYAHELAKEKIEELAEKAITSYLMASQRNKENIKIT